MVRVLERLDPLDSRIQGLVQRAVLAKKFVGIEDELMALATHWSQSYTEAVRTPEWRDCARWKSLLSDEGLLADGSSESVVSERQLNLFGEDEFPFPFPPKPAAAFRFIDLFAGVGGFRLAMQNLAGRCVFSCEINSAAKETYFRNFGEIPFGDIRQFTNVEVSDRTIRQCIPEHEVLCAGFPCQPFSNAGVSARESLGQVHGFECTVQGTLFFDLARIAKVCKPKVLFLENVRNLVSHDKGNTFKRIRDVVTNELGYSFHHKIVDARSVVPQKRIRCFMVCFRDGREDFKFPDFEGPALPLSSVLESPSQIQDEFTISDRMWAGHQRRTERNKARGAGFTTYAADLGCPSNTIVARYWKDGKECLVPQAGKNPRTLSPRECARLQGFPDQFLLPDRKKSAYMQMGNSVVVPVVEKIAKRIIEYLG